jgi:hypothetical protein
MDSVKEVKELHGVKQSNHTQKKCSMLCLVGGGKKLRLGNLGCMKY